VAVFARSTYFGRDSGHSRKRLGQRQMLCSASQEIGREIEIGDFGNTETWRFLLGLYIVSRPQAALRGIPAYVVTLADPPMTRVSYL
jgi:hypothetical protein